MKNYGIDIEKEIKDQKPQDWVFGAASPRCIAEIPDQDTRLFYLPSGEVQRGAEDTMDCATRAPLNILETKFNYLFETGKLPKTHVDFLEKNGYLTEHGIEFSDAFIAILSGTTTRGNSLIAPCDAIHTHGLIPKKMLPLVPTMTFSEYHDPERITEEMRAIGKKFLELFSINYERVLFKDFPEVLKTEMIDSAGYAWSNPVNGEYPNVAATPNHAFMVIGLPMYTVFDNYIDGFDGDFIKKLASDYNLYAYGYRMIVSLGKKKPSVFERLIELIKKLFNK